MTSSSTFAQIDSIITSIDSNFVELDSLNITPKLQEADSLIQFEKITSNFGEVQQGNEVSAVFVFTNYSQDSISIAEVLTGCTCQTVYIPENPIPPTESAEIEILFNTKNKLGKQNREISVIFSNNRYKKLYIKGKILLP